MIGQARFSYTDADMIATQAAGWTWLVRPRNLLLTYGICVVFTGVLFAALNATHGIATTATDVKAAIIGPVAEVAIVVLLVWWNTRAHGSQVLRGNRAFAWNGDDVGGEHLWSWDQRGLRIDHARGHADLAWSAVGAWLASPDVLLLVPAGGRAFSLPAPTLAAGWNDAPKVFFMPQGGYAAALPKRALAEGDAGRLVDLLREAGVPERRRFGLIAAKGSGARQEPLIIKV